MNMICFLDMDGVLADWNKGLFNLFHIKEDLYKKPENFGKSINEILHISKAEMYKNLNYDFYYNLDWMPDGKEILKLVEEKFKENICILTSPTRLAGCLQGKVDWINKHIPRYNERYLIGPDKSFCASSNKVLIDDSKKKTDKFKLYGGKTILIPRPWENNEIIPVIPYLKSSLLLLDKDKTGKMYI